MREWDALRRPGWFALIRQGETLLVAGGMAPSGRGPESTTDARPFAGGTLVLSKGEGGEAFWDTVAQARVFQLGCLEIPGFSRHGQ